MAASGQGASSLPFWGSETLALPVSGLQIGARANESGRSLIGSRSDSMGESERGCLGMKRFARILAVVSALAAVLMVAGASTKF